MPRIRRSLADVSVVDAAAQRLRNIYANGLPVYVSFSGGKDSLCLLHMIWTVTADNPAWRRQTTVLFFDEEAIFPCVERVVQAWRDRCLAAGMSFIWYCLEFKHFNCFNRLTNDESFLCWDRHAHDVWIRPMPPYAVASHRQFKPGKDSYQDFTMRATSDGIQVTGVRVAESVQRLDYMVRIGFGQKRADGMSMLYPIYDWTDDDVWRYLQEHDVEIPDAYIHMWRLGFSRRQMRISQFFSIDTAGALVRMSEFYPDLMDRIMRREPNAYLAALYWDSELFRRASPTKTDQEPGEAKDYKALTLAMLAKIPEHFDGRNAQVIAHKYRTFVMRASLTFTPNIWRDLYAGLVAGDPKGRTLRAAVTRHRLDVKSVEGEHAG